MLAVPPETKHLVNNNGEYKNKYISIPTAFHPADAIITGCKFIARAIFNSSFFSYDLWEVFHDRIIAVIYAVAPCFIRGHHCLPIPS